MSATRDDCYGSDNLPLTSYSLQLAQQALLLCRIASVHYSGCPPSSLPPLPPRDNHRNFGQSCRNIASSLLQEPCFFQAPISRWYCVVIYWNEGTLLGRMPLAAAQLPLRGLGVRSDLLSSCPAKKGGRIAERGFEGWHVLRVPPPRLAGE